MKRPPLPAADSDPHAAGPTHEQAEQAQPEPRIDPITSEPPRADNSQTIVEQPVNGDKGGEENGGPENNGAEGEGGELSAAGGGDLGNRVPATADVENASEEAGEPSAEGAERTTSEETHGPESEPAIGGEAVEPESEGGANVGTEKTGKSNARTRKNARKTMTPKTPSSSTASKGRKSGSTATAAVANSGSTSRVTRHSIAGSTAASTGPGRTLRDRSGLLPVRR
ncbi:hypothetical protein FRC08_011327 [Ceratobasidium sp. 394]|nr:hypothetical protein FRC08_011327 [Ceratobasidium sp. 394]